MAADLRENTEREKKFWNVNEVERRARRRPNYGMGNMNSGLEEICGNKLELTGPLIDSYLLEIKKKSKRSLSHSTFRGTQHRIL